MKFGLPCFNIYRIEGRVDICDFQIEIFIIKATYGSGRWLSQSVMAMIWVNLDAKVKSKEFHNAYSMLGNVHWGLGPSVIKWWERMDPSKQPMLC